MLSRIHLRKERLRRIRQYIIKRNKLYIKRKEVIDKHNDMVRITNTYKRLNIPFLLKSTYNSIIPLNLYTCWHTKELPPLMQNNLNGLINDNPEFNVQLYDEDDCREFIQTNFSMDILNAYNALIPCSYKSDLWRFCVLYINGGIYVDIKYQCVNNFKFIALTEKEHFVRDRLEGHTYTALIITLPKNEILLKCINQIVKNVNNKFYGKCLKFMKHNLVTGDFTYEYADTCRIMNSKCGERGKLYKEKEKKKDKK